jgi:polar amino acid transport system substrate-binding protein
MRGILKFVVGSILALAVAAPAAAQTCGTDYSIKDGDTLSDIASRVYGNPSQWTIIFYSNQDRLGSNASLLVPGLSIRLPCVGGGATQAPAAQAPAVAAPRPAEGGVMISSLVRRIEFLTADGYAPYTGRTLEGGGMITQLISSGMSHIKTESKNVFDYGTSWVNDWSAHLNPLLLTRAFDVGFPWSKPNCDDVSALDQNSKLRCQKFFFSEPIYEVVTLVFVRKDSRIQSLRTDEISGATVCQAAGASLQEFDQGGRNWLKDGKITMMRPPSIKECFRLLDAGTVDAVASAELVGRSAALSAGVADRVREVEPPLGLTTLHAVISKSHPHARTMLYYINASLSKLRETGDYDRIVERHLSLFWDQQARVPNPALATSPAAAVKAPPAGRDYPASP